jgi:hypothetical protein
MDNVTIDINNKASFCLVNEEEKLVVMNDEYYRELISTIKVLKGLDDVKKGKVMPAESFFSEFRLKHKRYTIEITETAQNDYNRIYSYLAHELCVESSAKSITSLIEEKISRLSHFPLFYPLCSEVGKKGSARWW